VFKGSWVWREAERRIAEALSKGNAGSASGDFRCDTGPGGCHVCIEALRETLRDVVNLLDMPDSECYDWSDED